MFSHSPKFYSFFSINSFTIVFLDIFSILTISPTILSKIAFTLIFQQFFPTFFKIWPFSDFPKFNDFCFYYICCIFFFIFSILPIFTTILSTSNSFFAIFSILIIFPIFSNLMIFQTFFYYNGFSNHFVRFNGFSAILLSLTIFSATFSILKNFQALF